MNAFDITSITSIIIKWFVVFGLFVYIIFAWILVRQEHLMAKELEERYEPILRFLVFLHLIASVTVFVLGILIL